MVSVSKKLKYNVEGNYFVDSSCINCDTCREVAPNNFEERDGYSIVIKQPETAIEDLETKRAIIACPTGSIQSVNDFDRQLVRKEFPFPIDDNVYYCGFNSPKSYGAKSYFIQDNDFNVLVDSPKFSKHLVNQFEAMGGIDYIFLTHRDDVAQAHKFADHFGAMRIIHEGDISVQKDAEMVVKGKSDRVVEDNLIVIPTPGHTKGHSVLLYNDKFLFTGDHVWWRSDLQKLRVSRRYNWWKWSEQILSIKKLMEYKFEWILPGHGHRVYFESTVMSKKIQELYDEISDPDYW